VKFFVVIFIKKSNDLFSEGVSVYDYDSFSFVSSCYSSVML
jgi:hypothetical protein